MVRSSRPTVKTLTINRSRDIVVEKLVKQCSEGNHLKCTGWAVLRKEHSPINANYFLKCTCACHKKGSKINKTKKRTAGRTLRRRKIVRKARPGRKARKARRR